MTSEQTVKFMKQLTKTKSALVAATFLSLATLLAMVSGNATWAMAGIFGLATLSLSTTLRQPELVLVRIRSPKGHF
jgi:hypothetical protein